MLENSHTAAAVIGHPIAHSRSPMIHNHWLSKYNLPGIYEAIDVDPAHLARFCRILRKSGLKGINVTIPHKEAIMAHCTHIDETAKKIGAVNTISVHNQELYGTNTDAYGFIEHLKTSLPAFDISASRPLILGAGGASRAVLYGLLEEGVKNITLTNRTQDKAKRLAHDFPQTTPAHWDVRSELIADHDLIINTTSLGMHKQPPLDIDLANISSKAVIYDLIYNPLQTSLMLQAETKGCRTIGGLGMLAYQAQKAFEIWFGITPDVTDTLMQRLEESL